MGAASLTFRTTSDYPILVLFLKNQRKFFAVSVVLRDATGQHRKLTLTNHVTQATMDAPNGSEATLPLKVNEGWQCVPVDLKALTLAVWGAEYRVVEQVNPAPPPRSPRIARAPSSTFASRHPPPPANTLRARPRSCARAAMSRHAHLMPACFFCALRSVVRGLLGCGRRPPQVRVRANCGVRRVFLSDRMYADVELPLYLRALG